MKNLIACRSDDTQKNMLDITLPYIEKYSKKCDADLIFIIDTEGLHHHYRILQFYDLFDHYDRIMSLDIDTLILDRCPNIFEYVSENKIGTIFEDVGTRKFDRRGRIKKIQDKFGDIGWKSGYINTGVSIFSKCHKDIFYHDEDTELYLDLGYDDIYLGYQINKRDYEVQELDFRWSHMSMFSESWNDNAPRFNSYVIHYAGNGGFIECKSRLDIMKEDEIILKKYGMLCK